MQLSDLESVLAPFHDVVIPFIQVRRRSQFRSRYLRDRAEVQPIHNQNDEVEEIDDGGRCRQENDALAGYQVNHRDFQFVNWDQLKVVLSSQRCRRRNWLHHIGPYNNDLFAKKKRSLGSEGEGFGS